ncbi:MAG: efflux RND transporter periplasmic adaptor subunit [Rhodospirillales bacterium]|nr:efflux RND transporter periplasmic adaptor subunit [Rhodospirillales bacterium]
MRLVVVVPVVVLVAAGAAYGGYWFARHHAPGLSTGTSAGTHPADLAKGAWAIGASDRKVLYYKDPMGKPDVSPVPKKDDMGMDYIPVFEDEEPSLEPAAPSQADHAHGAPADRKVLYYRNPMGLPDTSPVPKKDPMGMDYIPVYTDQGQDDGSVVTVSPARVQMLGVRTETAARRTLMRPVRAVGTVQFSERQMTVVSTKFEGWIETLYVNTTGEPVRRGEPLMQIYSPLLVQTQQEYVDAAKMAASLQGGDVESETAAARLVEGALQRLRYLDVPQAEVLRLQRERQANRTIAWPAPFSGIVLEKMVFDGMRFMPGEPLFKIAGISPIWVIAEVFEQDLAHVAIGQPATITVKAYPGRSFQGRVAYIYPTVGQETRTGTVRIEIPNPSGELKADMYASVELDTHASAPKVLTVPDSAVIDNGVRQVVLIERAEGRYEPRPVKVGAKADGYTEIRDGVKEGEDVVISANFLIDAESNLKAALSAFTAGEHQHP